MLLRHAFVFVGMSLLAGCTWFPSDSEIDSPEINNAEAGPPPSVLQVPPDLTRPNTNNQFSVPKQACACDTKSSASQTAAQPSGAGLEQRLQELKNLRDKGLITEQELQQKRQAVLQSL